MDASDDVDGFVLELESIPGIEPPTREELLALNLAPPEGAAEAIVAYNGSLVWNYHVCDVVSRYPLIGVAGSEANRRFAELFKVWDDPHGVECRL